MADLSLNDKYLEQAKWILTPNNVKSFVDCPNVSGCVHCFVYNYYSDENYCSVKHKIESSKHYLNIVRVKKLKRISE